MAAEHRKTFLKKYMEGFMMVGKGDMTGGWLASHLPPVLMDGMVDEVTLDEFKIFYGLDRELYTILVRDLCRNPSESLQIMGFWLWLERGGFCNLISKILSLRQFLINKISDEALTCLKLVNNQFPVSSEAPGFPLTQRLINSEISPQYFHENRRTIFHDVQNLVSDVYIPALSDIMEQARHGGFVKNPTRTQIPLPVQTRAPSFDELLAQSFSSLSVEGDASRSLDRVARANETMPKYARTMFLTFSKGYPVTETEVREFFTRLFGDCIDSLYMQEVEPDEQALYARVVFFNPSYIRIILDGDAKAKFSINGKHVWMRQFVPRNGRMLPCGCPSVGPSTCPHHHQ
ncbi:hypothetical protein DH2020_039516 [Rehmannia glutinosa]|uniref:RRM domain-containing protein n=1 Tax=Rehmannia glutinosa TaxID=99300 RepID=A0ABR0UXH7_REHGL